MMIEMTEPAVQTRDLVYHYRPQAKALDGLTLSVRAGEVFGLLGPNGCGKTTLFRLLTTYYPLQEGSATILGHDLRYDVARIRQLLGVVFQSPSLDKILTVRENLRCHAVVMGLPPSTIDSRIATWTTRLGLSDRLDDRVDQLSGGLARRVELAKGLLHDPRLLILDEPSTGLDPAARADFWEQLRLLQRQGVTILLTTHWMEEAERCDRIAIVDSGRVVAEGRPDALRREVEGDVLTLTATAPDALADWLQAEFGIRSDSKPEGLRCEVPNAFAIVSQLSQWSGGQITAMTMAKPSLEDVFLRRTGIRFDEADLRGTPGPVSSGKRHG